MSKFLTVIFLTFTFVASGQKKEIADKDKIRINNVCDKFMQTFVDGRIHEALQILKQNTVISHASIDTLEVTITNQLTILIPSYGKILSSEFIIERKAKNTIARRLYILKFEQYYLKFDFTLYNNGNHWTITNFNYNEDLNDLL